MTRFYVWLNAVRPQSLLASIAPVIIGILLAVGDGFTHWPSAFAALGVAVFLQIGTNLSNDYFDFISGVDLPGEGRPDSALVKKELTTGEIKLGFIIAFFLAVLCACILVMRLGVPAVIILFSSLIAGYWYTAGKWSLARLGLGDIFVLIFFGPVATAGTYFAITYEYNFAAVVAGFMPGFLSTGVLVINNLRDINSDKAAGRLTLAVRFGKSFTRIEYLCCVLGAAAVPVAFYVITGCRVWTLACSLIIFLMTPVVHDVFTVDNARIHNRSLALTSIFLFIQSILFGVLWLL